MPGFRVILVSGGHVFPLLAALDASEPRAQQAAGNVTGLHDAKRSDRPGANRSPPAGTHETVETTNRLRAAHCVRGSAELPVETTHISRRLQLPAGGLAAALSGFELHR